MVIMVMLLCHCVAVNHSACMSHVYHIQDGGQAMLMNLAELYRHKRFIMTAYGGFKYALQL